MKRRNRPDKTINVTVNLAVDRYKPETFLAAYVELKFYMFEGTSYKTSKQAWMIYEQCPEEGPGVRKKIASFDTEEECLTAFAKIKSELAEYLNVKFRVVAQQGRAEDSVPSPGGNNTTVPAVALETSNGVG